MEVIGWCLNIFGMEGHIMYPDYISWESCGLKGTWNELHVIPWLYLWQILTFKCPTEYILMSSGLVECGEADLCTFGVQWSGPLDLRSAVKWTFGEADLWSAVKWTYLYLILIGSTCESTWAVPLDFRWLAAYALHEAIPRFSRPGS